MAKTTIKKEEEKPTGRVFQRILVATDGSEKNRSAVAEGVRIARSSGASLFAVYVIDNSLTGSLPGGVEPVSIGMVKTFGVLDKEALESLRHVSQTAGEFPVTTRVLEGRPAEAIVQFALENQIDLIVIGTLGKTGFERLLLGSVADKVIRTAACDVLIVK